MYPKSLLRLVRFRKFPYSGRFPNCIMKTNVVIETLANNIATAYGALNSLKKREIGRVRTDMLNCLTYHIHRVVFRLEIWLLNKLELQFYIFSLRICDKLAMSSAT